MAGTAGTTRTFTSVESAPTTWSVALEGLAGLVTTLNPTSFDIAPGQSQPVTLGFTAAEAPPDIYVFGALVLTEAATGRTLRLPISVRPVQLSVPDSLDLATDQPEGNRPVAVRSGYDGELSALGWGLATPASHPGQTIGLGEGAERHQPSAGVNVFDVNVPPGTQLLAGRVGNADGGGPAGPDGKPPVDLDLFLLYDDEGDGFDAADGAQPVAQSADPDADEAITIIRPRPGAYRFSVVGYRVAEPTSSYDFTTWLLADPAPDDPAVPAGGPGVAVGGDPVAVGRGAEVALPLDWSGLTTDGTYLGLVTWHQGAAPDPATPIAGTLLRIVRAPAGTRPPPWPE
jgi:hypothetical protein